MNRVTVALSDLKPNPFKKDICGGRLDPEVVSQIKESATKTSFWEQWVVRKTDAGYEMAFGHHRLQAAIELFGAAHRVGVQLEDYSDEQMMIALADENSGDEASTEERVDTVVRAGKGLKDGGVWVQGRFAVPAWNSKCKTRTWQTARRAARTRLGALYIRILRPG